MKHCLFLIVMIAGIASGETVELDTSHQSWNKWELAMKQPSYDDSISHRSFDDTSFQPLVIHSMKTHKWEYAVSADVMEKYLRKIMLEQRPRPADILAGKLRKKP